MITKEEFSILKEKYWTEEYKGTTIILGNDITRILTIVPYRQHIYSNRCKGNVINHQIIEFTPEGYTVYGVSGNKIKGDIYGLDSSIQASEKVLLEGWDEKNKVYLSSLTTGSFQDFNIQDYELVTSENGRRLLDDLINANISIQNISYPIYHFTGYHLNLSRFNDTNIIKQVFGIPAKDLRVYLEYFKNPISISRAIDIKQLMCCSASEAVKYLGALTDSGIWSLSCLNDSVDNKIRLLKYVLNSHFTNYEYGDYLRMRRLIENIPELSKRFPKFPKDYTKVHEYHDDLTMYLSRRDAEQSSRSMEDKQRIYEANYYSRYKKLEYKDETYSIIACKNLSDLILEGKYLSHCVGTYVNSVSQGCEGILFLRQNSNLDVPYFTVNIIGKKIRQVHGKYNCNVTEEIKTFIEKWASQFNLDSENYSGMFASIS